MSNQDKILFLTNHMTDLTGSSFVVLEFAQEFIKRGYQVDVGCVALREPMSALLSRNGINAFTIQEVIDPCQYRIIWCQHITFGWIDLKFLSRAKHRISFVFSHLGPTEPLEQITCPLELSLADAILFNSPETLSSSQLPASLQHKAMVFYNACPEAFFKAHRIRDELARILYVSNHSVPELDRALEMLRSNGYHVERIGVANGVYRPILPNDLNWADTLVSIGKTAIYGLVAGVPVYIYGPHGGPGYVTSTNFNKNASYNFSGRPFNIRKSAEVIASELVRRRQAPLKFTSNLSERRRKRYNLSAFTSELIKKTAGGSKKEISHDMLIQQQLYRNVCEAWRRNTS
ncbi:hypothetical protein [Ensifer sp. ENS03]|uniref:hypothetical protein n=1 Tax=Ensifer sp. ENS03 TaxID=2769283 RepID=UPI0017844C47|nr:hypothetical protein [Ensifer sp. ENS03]MBD9559603.1 hypothetical protein [Ensifer sp. ENS03]